MRRRWSGEPRQGVVQHRRVGCVRLVHATVGIRARRKNRERGIAAGRSVLAVEAAPGALRSLGWIGAQMAGIVVRNLSDWRPIAVRFP
jgi:hypothetical protein